VQNQSAIVPFHGSFEADASTFELIRLKMTADKIPMGLKICRAESEVSYQMANIFGVRTMIPESFELQVDDDTHVHTVSRGEYSRCREFRAESKVRFDNPTPVLDNSAREHRMIGFPLVSLCQFSLRPNWIRRPHSPEMGWKQF
jgi:hypothetical protein